MKLNLNRPVAFIDLETTGLNIATDRIVEICILKVDIEGETEVKTQRINPTIPIPPETTAIHGIRDEDVVNSPTFSDVAQELATFINNCDIGGFNAGHFDVPLLVEEFLRAGVEYKSDGVRIVDVQKIFHRMEPRNLTAAYKFYCGKDLDEAHSAEADIRATYDVLLAQLDKYQDVIRNDVEYLDEFTSTNKRVDFAGRMVFDKQGKEVFNFGKHKGKLVEDVLKNEPQYYDWIMKADFPLDTKRKLTALKLKEVH
ncbi:MAG: 3'-5' exonuclease [Bacteroidetes bacterium]|nr:3'-5' exonuclease [Bacteroidota bacterium]